MVKLILTRRERTKGKTTCQRKGLLEKEFISTYSVDPSQFPSNHTLGSLKGYTPLSSLLLYLSPFDKSLFLRFKVEDLGSR